MKTKGMILVMVLSIGFLTSCEEFDTMLDDVDITIDSDYYEVEYGIPPAPEGLEVAMEEVMEMNVDEMLAEEGYDKSDIKSVKLSYASIEVTDTIHNLDAIGYLRTAIDNESMPEELIASFENDSVSKSAADMELIDVELKEYFDGNHYTLINYGMLRETTTDTIWIKCKVKYEVTVSVSAI